MEKRIELGHNMGYNEPIDKNVVEAEDMTLREYLDSLKDKTVAVIGIGVSNTPLLRLLLRENRRPPAGLRPLHRQGQRVETP